MSDYLSNTCYVPFPIERIFIDDPELTALKRNKKKTRRSRWCAGNHPGLMLKCKKKKEIVAAILDFWRAFLNQFWSKQIKRKQGDLDDAREITAVWTWNVKKLNFVAAILDYWRSSLIDNMYLISLYTIIYGNNNLYQLCYFYHKVNDRYTNCHILPILHNAERE